MSVRGLPKAAYITNGAVWKSRSELTLHFLYKQSVRAYLVDINTGQARHTATYTTHRKNGAAIPGVAGE